MALLQKKFSNLLLAVPVAAYLAWYHFGPVPWAPDLVKAAVAACYAEGSNGSGANYGLIRQGMREAEEKFGGLISYKFVSVQRGLSNRSYDVTIDAIRQRNNTREVITVSAAFDKVSKREWASPREIVVSSR